MSLQVRGLAVERGGRLLFRDLSFAVEPGGVLAVVGRNGAGKSSLLRVLAGLLEPLAGQIDFSPRPKNPAADGHSYSRRPGVGRDSVLHGHVHYCGHLDAVKPAMTVRETLSFWSALYGGRGEDIPRAESAWALTAFGSLPGHYLSAGQKRRVALARLSVAARPVWLLDEPSASLDAGAKALLIAQGDAHLAGGGIILAASHEPLWRQASALDIDAVTRGTS